MHGPTEGAPSLQIVAGRGNGTFIPIGDEPFVIGRAEEGAGSLFDDPELSRRHALVSRTSDGGLVVADLDSTNGTYVNGNRLTGPAPVTPGDAVWVGSTTLQVVDLAGEPGMKRVARIARMPGGVQRIPDEIVRILDQRAPVPREWVIQVFGFAVVIALGANFLIRTFAIHVVGVSSDLGPLQPVRMVIATIMPCVGNSCGFYANFHRRTAQSTKRYLIPTGIISLTAMSISLSALADFDVASVITAIVVAVLPLSIIVPRLLSLPSRARALPPPPASELAADHTEKEASVG